MSREGAQERVERDQGDVAPVGGNTDVVRPSCSVMVIDDNVHMRQLLELRLARHDRLVLGRSFANAEDALLVVGEEGPDVVLCDVGLPGMSGLEAVPLLRDACPDALIVMYTVTPEAARHAVRLGADAVVGKNTTPSRLLEVVLDLADQRTPSGAAKVPAVRGRWPAGHLGWSFADQAQFDRAITSFLTEGTTFGERLVLVTDNPRPSQWPDVLFDEGDLLTLSTTDVYGRDRIVDAATQRGTFHTTLQEAVRRGYSGLRVAADNTSLVLGPDRLEAWLRWESEAEDLMQTNVITGLCTFDRSRLDAATLETLLSVHATRPEPQAAV